MSHGLRPTTLGGKQYLVQGARRAPGGVKYEYTCDAWKIRPSGDKQEVKSPETLDALARLKFFGSSARI